MASSLANFTLVVLLISGVNCAEKIAFPSGATLLTSDETATRFQDAMKTGSKLFMIGDEGVTDSKRLTLNIDVGSYRDSGNSYFRAHPVFMRCVQRAWSEVQNSGRKVQLRQGFKPTSGSKLQDLYSRAGTGVRLAFASSESRKSFSSMAVAFLRHCPLLFGPLGRDLGLIIESDAIFVFMTGEATPSKFSITSEGANPDFAGVSNLRQWAIEKLNNVTQPTSTPKCGVEVSELSVGQTHPTGATIRFVGPLERAVRRTSTAPDKRDFLRLVQFPSNNLAFPAGGGANCPADGGYLGNGVTTRCGPRLMTPRLFSCLNHLQQMVRTQLKVELKVTEGWTESGPADSLRLEGREVRVQPKSGGASNLGKIARLAVCASCDFVQREADAVRLAVVKQFDSAAQPVVFPATELLPVAAAASEWKKYQPRSPYAAKDYPLFDGLLERNVSDGVPLSLFRSKEPDVRHLRLHPAMVKCFAEVLRWENRHQSGAKVGVTVVRGFLSSPQEASLMSAFIDERLDKNTLGIGMQLKYTTPNQKFTLWRLAQTIASVCPLVFKMQEEDVGVGRDIGVGVYSDGIHVDIRHQRKIWYECEECHIEPPGGAKAFRAALSDTISLSANSRIFDPSDPENSCKFDDPPAKQNASFVHKHAEAVKRTRRSTTTPAECQMNAPMSDFCRQSQAARTTERDKIWRIISYKHLVVPKTKVLAALNGCILACSKCTAGPQWDSKVKNCNNLIHWVPFGTLNAAGKIRSNLYPRSDKEASRRACEAGEHCVDQSPLFALFIDSLMGRFRPVPSKPNSELIYDPVANPSPLPVLIRKLYAFYAQGEAKVWVRSEADVIAMVSSLKVFFVYNKAITKVQVFALDPAALSTIVAALEAHLEQWRTSSCPTTARPALTPYTAEVAPPKPVADAFRERHRVRELWEKFSSGVQRSDFL